MPPYNPDLYKKDVRPRFKNWDELNALQDELKIGTLYREVPAPTPENDSSNNLNRFANNLSFKNLGWEPAPDGTVPKDRNGNSRLFALHVGEDGRDVMVPLDGKDPPLRSQAFWDDVQRGNVFAIPAGDDRPVQVQLKYTGNTTIPDFSKPIEPKDLPMSPAPPEPRRPNIFKRAIHVMFKRAFKQEFDAYTKEKAAQDNWRAGVEKTRKQVSDICDNRSGILAQEKEDAAREKQRRAEAAERERLQNQLTTAKEKTTMVEVAMSKAKAVWEPEPKILEDEASLKRYPGRTIKAGQDSIYNRLYHREVTRNGKKETQEGFFNIDTFGDVKPIGKDQLDLNSIHKGDSGKTFDTEDFVALTLAATAIPRIGVNGIPYSPEPDNTQVEAMMNLKVTEMVDGKPVEKPRFTKEEATMLASDVLHMHYTTDVMEPQTRDNSGRFAKPVVEPARQLTKNALNRYKEGNPKDLAEIVAHGIRSCACNVTGKEAPPGRAWKGEMKYAGKLVEMLDADPKLAEAARKAGMKEADLNTVRGVNELMKLDQKGADANLKLAEAASGEKVLTPEEKKQAVKDVLMAKMALETMVKENKDKPCKEYDEMFMGPMGLGAYGQGQNEGPEVLKIRTESKKGVPRPLPPPGKIYEDTGGNLADALKCQKKERPAAVILLSSPTYRKNLEKAAEQIIQEDKLLEKSPDQLTQELDYGTTADRTKTGERAMAIMSRNGVLDEVHRKEMAREVKNPAQAQELADAFAANQAQVPKQEAPQKQGELAPKEQAAEGLAV